MKFEKGAKNAVKGLGLKKDDRVVIVTDYDTLYIADEIRSVIEDMRIENLFVIIEEAVGERPAKEFPDSLKNKLSKFNPTASYYIAKGYKGELQKFRSPLVDFLVKDLNCRHGHMLGIDADIMLEGMASDPDKIYERTKKVYDIVNKAMNIEVKGKDTNIKVKLDPSKYKWKLSGGKYTQQGIWGNLPDGEVFTCPEKLNGKISAYILGDYFTSKYGKLKMSLNVEVENSRVINVQSENKELEDEFKDYIQQYENGDRVGELGIGTLEALKDFTGNLLQDEKFPGIHVAFGYPYPEVTNADWTCPTHLDIIPVDCSIWVDDKQIMERGKYLI